MRSLFIQPTIFLCAAIIALAAIGCSNGDLSRSEAKKQLSKTVDMCDPCVMEEYSGHTFGVKLLQLGYLDRASLTLTPLGENALGKDSITRDPKQSYGWFSVAAFKKEIDEVTGIAVDQRDTGLAEVQFTYRIVPLFDVLRDDPRLAIAVLDQYGSNHLDRRGTVEEKDGKFIAYHTKGEANFKKYDDGWRVAHPIGYSNQLYLKIVPYGGLARSLMAQR